MTMLLSLMAIAGISAIAVARGKQNRALLAAENLRHAIATGQQREIETGLRKQLALAAAGEAVSLERQWLARAQLGGLLVAEWRLDEAHQIYGTDEADLSPHLKALADFGRHELAVLTEPVDATRLEAIRADRDRCLAHVPPRYQRMVADAWHALEGLCLVRMGRAGEAVSLLEDGLESLAYNPARVVYLFHLAQAYEQTHQPALASETYEEAMVAYPGSRLASEAKARRLALTSGGEGMFRGMLPEAPIAESSGARGVLEPQADSSGPDASARSAHTKGSA
jgi:tetratricopeptide (TPR) repeat protein